VARLRRTLGVAGLTFYGVGMIVGAGVYSVVGAAAGLAGEAMWLSFLAGSVVALLTALSYAELSTLFPRAGAEYVYVREALPRVRYPAFLLGVVLAFAAAGTAATVSLAFAGYLSALLPLPRPLVACVLIALLTAVNVAGLHVSSRINVVFTLLEVGGLVAFAALGAAQPGFGDALAPEDLGGVAAAAALLFFAYLGFEDVVNLAEETRRPEKDLPRAVFVSVGITTVLYVAVALAAVALVDPGLLAHDPAPLATAAAEGSPLLARVLGFVALFATANTALIALLTGSRMVFGMADNGDLPPLLGRVRARAHVPWTASIAVALLAGGLVPVGGVSAVASLASFAALLAFVAVNACVVVLRWRRPDERRPFRVPGAVGRVPVLPVLGVLSAGLLLWNFDVATYVGGGIALAVATVLFAVSGAWRRARPARPRGKGE
jgi:amino acid transporter